MFVREGAQLAVGFIAAHARLADLARSGWLLSASEVAYRAGTAGRERFGAPGSRSARSGLVRVYFLELIVRRDSADLALRWEAAGAGGQFPALDADITLSAAGEHATTLALAGVYRAPSGNVGDGDVLAVPHRAALAAIRTLVDLMAAAITAPGAGRDTGPAGGGEPWPPASQAP